MFIVVKELCNLVVFFALIHAQFYILFANVFRVIQEAFFIPGKKVCLY